MKERMRNGSDKKREEALVQKRKRIVSLQKLKEQGGPFTSAEEVDTYLSDLDETNKKEKQKRMKLEISYARDTSTLLQKVDPLFKIRKVDLKGKQRDNTATEFGKARAGSPPGQEGRQEGNGLFNIHGLPDKNGGLEQSFCDMTIIC